MSIEEKDRETMGRMTYYRIPRPIREYSGGRKVRRYIHGSVSETTTDVKETTTDVKSAAAFTDVSWYSAMVDYC